MTLCKRFSRLFVLLTIVLVAGCGNKAGTGTGSATGATVASGTLKVGIIPYDKIQAIKENYGPFVQYLGKKCGGRNAEVFVTPEYAGVIQALKSDQIDCAYLNPLSYTLAVQEFKDTPEHLIPLAMPYFHHSLTYKGIIFARADSGINTLKDFKGKSFAFGDVTSTSSYLYPAGMFKELGVDPKTDLKPVNITGPSAVLAVFNKQVAGGAIYDGGIENAFTDHKVVDTDKVKQLKVIATTDPIPNGMFVARGNLDAATLDHLRKALSDVNTDADGKAALAKIPWDKLVPGDDSIFDPVRKKATILNLNLQSLDKKDK